MREHYYQMLAQAEASRAAVAISELAGEAQNLLFLQIQQNTHMCNLSLCL